MATLLEKAKAHKITPLMNNYNIEHFELAIAFVNSEITARQLEVALKGSGKKASGGTALYFATNAIKKGIRDGKIKIKLIK